MDCLTIEGANGGLPARGAADGRGGGCGMAEYLDAIDQKILAELQANGRIAFAELGRRVGLSTPAVSERVRRLEEAAVIERYIAVVDPAEGGPAAAGVHQDHGAGRPAAAL